MRSFASLVLLAVALPPAAAEPTTFPLPPVKEEWLGLGVQRTMTLLATSTPEHRNKVRILFYGQSITEQEWSKQVADSLRKRFPHADLEIENRAIGGFAAQLLIRPAEHDLYPFYPDLLIFHVYGSNKEYEEIIRSVRSRTTAEVLMQKDHVTKWPPEVIDEKKDKGAWWDDLMNHHLLPDIAKKYGCGLVDVRGPWLDYLTTNHLEPRQLLKDDVHLNDHGNYLMAGLVSRYLVYRPELPKDAWQGLVQTREVGKDLKWEDGKLRVEFEGNRIDLVAEKVAGGAARAAIRIDGRKPSEFPGCYRITRPQPGPWSPLTVTRVDHDQPLKLEEWSLKITSVTDDATGWEFTVNGSQTGADGGGSNAKPFVSPSGRVKIAPEAWFRHGKVPVGYEIKWKVLPTFTDEYTAPPVTDAARESSVTVAQGLPNEKHVMVIVLEGKGEPGIRSVQAYRPPVR